MESLLYDFCNMNVESLSHLFWDCHIVRAFWAELENFLHEKGFRVAFDFKVVSFGSENNTLLNFIIILAKYFIVKCKYKQESPNFVVFLQYMKKRQDIEKAIACMKDKIEIHEAKWFKLRDV